MLCVAETPMYVQNRVSSSAQQSIDNQPWYHGKITRLRSEELLESDGQFLIRDSISKPGDYVLTARWRGKVLHFQVNRVEEGGRFMFQFEDEQFTSVVSLIQFYMSHRRAVTFASGCIIREGVSIEATPTRPRNTSEYRELEANYAHFFRPATKAAPQRSLSQQVLLNQAMRLRKEPLPVTKAPVPRNGMKMKVPPLPAALVNRPLPIPEKSPKEADEGDEYCEMDYGAMDEMDTILNACGLSSSMLTLNDRSNSNTCLYQKGALLSRNYQSCADLTWRQPQSPTPTSSNRNSATESEARDSACVLDGSDNEEPKKQKNGEEEKRRSNCSDYDVPRKGDEESDYDLPKGTPRAVLKKTLNSGLLRTLRDYLLSRTPEEIALDICREDAKLLNLYKCPTTADNGLCRMLLPAGRDIREQLLTRVRTMQLSVVASVLGGGTRDAQLLSVWINVASKLMISLGNHFAFFSVFCGITCKLLESPTWLWSSLTNADNERFEDCARAFTQLRLTGLAPSAAATTAIPLLQPILQIFSNENSLQHATVASTDLEVLWQWLEMAREWTSVAAPLAALATERYGVWCESPLASSQLLRLLGLDSDCPQQRYADLEAELQKAAVTL